MAVCFIVSFMELREETSDISRTHGEFSYFVVQFQRDEGILMDLYSLNELIALCWCLKLLLLSLKINLSIESGAVRIDQQCSSRTIDAIGKLIILVAHSSRILS